jgi:hypothetical protein
MARLAIARAFLAEYAKLDTKVQGAVDAAVARLAKHAHPGQHLEKPKNTGDDRIRFMRVDTRWRGIVLTPAAGTAAHTATDTYCLVTLLPRDKANAYATSLRAAAMGSRSQARCSPGRIRPES